MVNATSIKSKVSNIIVKLGSSLTLNHVSETYDKWGDNTETVTSTETITAVPISYLKEVRNALVQGVDITTTFTLVVNGDENILLSNDDYVTYLGVDYRVISVEPIPLQDVILAQLVLLEKK